MRRACRERQLYRWPPWQSRRCFQVIQRGHDRPQESLYDKLGFAKDEESHRVRRSVPELQQGLLRQVEKLTDPVHNPQDMKKLAELKTAYTLLHDSNFRANYGSHYYASNDARLHVLCDGGQVAANYNPEHQQFTYVDHAMNVGSRDVSGSSSVAAGSLEGQYSNGSEAPTAEVLRGAFRNATGAGDSAGSTTSSSAQAFKSAEAAGPLNGADITHLLRITLEQSLFGCDVVVELHKHAKCVTCRGSGRQRLSRLRKCPQCLGRGSAHLPSATYHIERRCLYCGGEGTVPPPPCRSCEGRGVTLNTPTRVTVQVPCGTVSNAFFRVRHYGHDGVRGGHAGDLLVTVLVSEHRYFYRRKEKQDELHAMLPLPLSVALLGGRVEVPTLTGRGLVHVPPCVRNGQVLPFSVYGVPELATSPAGTARASSPLFFHALVMIPRAGDLSGRQRQALDTYELHHSSPSVAAASCTAECVTEVETTEAHEQTSATTTSTLPPPPRLPSRDELMEECAALKNAYRHWFAHN
ncbi:chaperone protein DNAJ-like protein [Leptomonas pyrrhocoris]|uniref:Chaperone protein DNAJ-like protein n=1 Tax=Leptomonas pyrrhocoris TaxID=157538 RepID=A0A0M9FSU3_LEPPY|nr:chaperone protein DNAJ-like protein [Leptomonas pyrrhocoris]KPA75345.1 chaperone protein DNAJ-like protein [Leptomonas pyrrhocoris]|eukprot:XP_015653784.1 chaperone protein DNAJ-like protein [Leptomonas pyrrhocoris]